MGNSCKSRLYGFMHYESARYIRVNNWTIGILFYVLQFAILAYIIGFQIFIGKGYQRYDNALGTVQIKVKGAVSTGSGSYEDGSLTVYDANDVVIPSLEHDALLIQTNFLATTNQTRGICTGNDPNTEACAPPIGPCESGDYTINGINTGVCDPEFGLCKVYAWCPTENDTSVNYNLIDHVDDMTLYIRVNALFPAFGIAVQSLVFQTITPPGANAGVIPISKLLELAGTTYSQIQTVGTILLLSVTYDCDLNEKPYESTCNPTFSVSKIDASGFNYRYNVLGTDPVSGADSRDLYKVWGLRMVVYVSGRGGQYETATLAVTIGAGIGLLSVATVVCDFFLANCAAKKDEYTNRKIDLIVDTEPHPTDTLMDAPAFKSLSDVTSTAYSSHAQHADSKS